MYIKHLSAIIDSHSITNHSFADDIQLQISAPADKVSELLHLMQSCLGDIKAWATSLSLSKSRLKTYLFRSVSKDLTFSLITVHMCMVWYCYCFVDGLS